MICVSVGIGEFFRWEDQNSQSDLSVEEQALDVWGEMGWDEAAKLGRALYPMLCGVLRLDPIGSGESLNQF